MKHLSKSVVAVVLLMAFSSLAQDMNSEAGKLYNDGNGLLKAGNYQGAIEKYNSALSVEKDYRIYYQLGVAQKKAGNLQGAKSSFEECIKLNDGFEGGHNALGGVYFSKADYNQAIIEFEKVLKLTDKSNVTKKVQKNLSLAYTKLSSEEISNGNSAKAIEYLNKAVGYDNYDAAYLSLAKTYSDIGEWDKSISASENALKYKSKITSGGPYFYMGIAYKGKGENEKAKEMFQKAKTDAAYKKTAEYELSLLN
jgi:tetratricopeptide (TPR) repeat protein